MSCSTKDHQGLPQPGCAAGECVDKDNAPISTCRSRGFITVETDKHMLGKGRVPLAAFLRHFVFLQRGQFVMQRATPSDNVWSLASSGWRSAPRDAAAAAIEQCVTPPSMPPPPLALTAENKFNRGRCNQKRRDWDLVPARSQLGSGQTVRDNRRVKPVLGGNPHTIHTHTQAQGRSGEWIRGSNRWPLPPEPQLMKGPWTVPLPEWLSRIYLGCLFMFLLHLLHTICCVTYCKSLQVYVILFFFCISILLIIVNWWIMLLTNRTCSEGEDAVNTISV